MATSAEKKQPLSAWEVEAAKIFQEAPRKRAEAAADQVEKDLIAYAEAEQTRDGYYPRAVAQQHNC
jgi:hypothetical protein